MIERANVAHAHPVGEWSELIFIHNVRAFLMHTRKIEAIAKNALTQQRLARSTFY